MLLVSVNLKQMLLIQRTICLFVLSGSDMELDLLAAAETESDSESNHSNQDNASGRRSVVTAATAGSEAGWSTAFFEPFFF